MNFSKYISKINILQGAFHSRISELTDESNSSLFTNPLCTCEEKRNGTVYKYENEVIELKCNATLKGSLKNLMYNSYGR
jgi:hypothetical protein